jgi:anti-sigma factor RsiW
MNGSDERLELLIGKLLDGELSPSERQQLEEELGRNSRARALLEQLKTLDDSSRAALASRLVLQAGEPERVFERAWQCHEARAPQRVFTIRTDGRLRFVAGLAAGFLLGLVLHFVLVSAGDRPNQSVDPTEGAARLVADTGLGTGIAPTAGRGLSRPVVRNVDWYSFTDEAGNQWLVEGIREGMVRPASYHGELR